MMPLLQVPINVKKATLGCCVSCKIYKLAHVCYLSTPRKLFDMKNDQKLVTEYNTKRSFHHIIFPVFKVCVRTLFLIFFACAKSFLAKSIKF